MQVTPPAGRITLKACETQTFAVNDNPPRRYVWWIDAQRQAEQEPRLLFFGRQPGQHTLRVAVNGDDSAGVNWEVWVTPAAPSEAEVRQWPDAYRRALETQDFSKLHELGYLRSDQQAEALRDKLRGRSQHQVRI